MPIPLTSFRIDDRFKRPVVRLAALAIAGWLLIGCATAPEPKSAVRIPLQTPGCGLEENDRGLPSLAPLMRRVTPAVVTVSAESSIQTEPPPFLKDPDFKRFLDQMGLPMPEWDPSERRQSVGSGVIVDARRGYVMTNEHLLKDANKITVTLTDRRSFRARKLASDPSTDVAILKIPPVDVTPLPFGNSNRLEVGDFVIAIGNPFGLGQTVTLGIVSAVGRSDIAGNQLGELIQTDASINPGNSGGPLIDLTGAVVGINTALIGPTGGNVGIGFAVPSNRARTALDRVRK
ncbi:trypsin-like peptidase domain-containing protein [Thiorhodococcus fuscus]|uniref:Trypsin-like peptidase domain-containing protein n=1 Tax=Thiorhodococcus fuscus TaxID=527200 RepID=A0ABW4Y4N4_9GAMM